MPTDFRDGRTFPRRGRDRMGEAMWLLRAFDKARARAAGTIAEYIYPCPMDMGVMQRWGITPADFDAAIAAHRDDAAVYAWLTGRVASSGIEAANRWLREEKTANLDRQDAEESVIEFTRPDGASAPGYFAEASRRAPGVVLFEEWWGLTDHIKDIAQRLAAAGFSTLVPDLYRGRAAATGDEATHLMEGLDFNDAVTQDGRGAAAFLRARGSNRVAVMGYCMGGALAMVAAMNDPNFDATVIFYGYPPEQAGDPGSISIPVLGHWARNDTFFDIKGVDEIERKLRDARVPHEFHRYDAKHGFSNPSGVGNSGLGNYHAEHADTAWQRTIAFLKRTLQ